MFADITLTTESLSLLSVIGAMLVGGLIFLHKQLVAVYVDTIADLKIERDNWKNVATVSATNLERAASEKIARDGGEPFKSLPPVVPFSHSPVTEKEMGRAELETTQARVVAATVILGYPAREIKAADMALLNREPIRGVLVSVTGRTISLSHNGGEPVTDHVLASDAPITLDGFPVTLSDLAVGDVIEIDGDPASVLKATRKYQGDGL